MRAVMGRSVTQPKGTMAMATLVVLTGLAALLAGAAADVEEKQAAPAKETPMISLYDFDGDAQRWRIVDDGVMGGRSQGNWDSSAGVGVFSGTLSLENNGGFSSVRSDNVVASCAGATAFRIRVKGDGRTYQFRVRSSAAFDGASYRLMFDTKAGEWQEIDLPLENFEASFRGRVLGDYPALEGEKVVTVGFLLADKNPGGFQLEVDWIKAKTTGTPDAAPAETP